MPQNQLWVPYDGELSWPINEPKRQAAVECMSRALSRFLALRSRLYLRRGMLVVDADADGAANAIEGQHESQQTILSGICAACRRRSAVVGHTLCAHCRNIPLVLMPGPTLVESMYSCGHPKLLLTHETAQTISRLFKRQSFVFETMRQSKAFEMMALGVLDDSTSDTSDGNFFFDDGWTTNPSSPFLATMRYPRRLHEASRRDERDHANVGGIGLRLRAHVVSLAANWLRRVDDLHRVAFDKLAMSSSTDADVQLTIDFFADLIARRVTRTEADDTTSPKLEVATLEAEAEKRFVHARQRATAEVRRDILRMIDLRAVLSVLSDAEERWLVLASPARRAAVADVLQSPPPELRAGKLPLASMVDVDLLSEALTCANRYATVAERDGALREIVGRALNPACLLAAVQESIDAANCWRHPRNFFLAIVQKQTPATAAAAIGVPPPPWAHSHDDWVYRTAAAWMRGRQRIGLDLSSLRIVLLSSMLIEMLASERSPFEAGLLKAEHVVAVAGSVYQCASSASKALCEQLRPLLAGVEYAQARTAVLQSQCNHLDTEMQHALCPLSNFSIRDLMTCFWPGAPLFSALAHSLSRRTTECMVIKPEPGYEEFVQTSLALFLPIISSSRLALGVDRLTTTMHELGDVLRTLPAFCDWAEAGGVGSLVLSKDDLRYGAPEAQATLDRWARRNGPVRWMKYQNRVMRFVFHPGAVEMVFGAARW